LKLPPATAGEGWREEDFYRGKAAIPRFLHEKRIVQARPSTDDPR